MMNWVIESIRQAKLNLLENLILVEMADFVSAVGFVAVGNSFHSKLVSSKLLQLEWQ